RRSGLEPGDEAAEVGDLELAIAVGEGDEAISGGSESGPQGSAVAEVRRVVDGPNLRMRRRELVGEGRRFVARAVVDDDDLVLVRKAGQGPERFCDRRAEVRDLV